MKTSQIRIDESATVNEVVRSFPATIPVFNEFGIDSCCGGGVAIGVAADRDGADLETLIERLNAAVAGV